MAHSINLGDILARNPTGTTPFNITAQMRHWTDSVVDIGGFYQASGDYWLGQQDDLVEQAEAEQFFLTRLGAHIVRADKGGSPQWEGYISEMELTENGITQVRSMADIITKIRVAYTKYSGNYLLNGSGELGSWTGGQVVVNGVITIHAFATTGGTNPLTSFSTAWCTHGAHSVKVDTTSEGYLDGGGVTFHSETAAVADARYCVRADIYTNDLHDGANITLNVTDGSKEIYARVVTATTGTFSFSRTFDAPADASGNLNVSIYVYSNANGSNSAVFYVDNVQLYQAGTPAQTPWAEDTAATALWGLHEESIICKPMTDDEALQRRDLLLTELAYPHTKVVSASNQSDGLHISCEGYIFKTFSASTTLGGIKACSTHITDLLTDNAFVSAGYIATNALECYIDETQPINIWLALQDVIEFGGSSNVFYVGGCYANRGFVYEPRATTASIKFKGGNWLNLDNSPMNPQAARPCIAYMEDMVGAVESYPNLIDNPQYIYIPAWEFDGDTETATPKEVKDLL